MVHVVFLILAATIINALVSLVGVVTLWCNEKTMKRIVFIMVAFSAGALLGGALLHIAAEAIEMMEANMVFLIIITGFSAFFLLERFVYWHHCHDGVCDVHPYTYLILFGDGIHNFIDGLIIAASFMVNPALGIMTTIIIIAHEVPQELGDFGVLVFGGMKKRKALGYNLISQLTAIVGGMIGFLLSSFSTFSMFMLPFAAGGFIYIAASDLIPELHKEVDRKKSIMSFIFFIIGVLFMLGTSILFG
jgi:zinc and cadmium transporter